MRGKWAAGIPPRKFTWVIKDRLAVSERPGGFGPHHRPVRRHEELLWLKGQGFDKVVSLLPSPHNLQAYDEAGLPWAAHPLAANIDPRPALADCYKELDEDLASRRRILVHHDGLGDHVMGAVGGFLVWSGRVPTTAQALWLVERLVGRQMGAVGRELVVVAEELERSAPPGPP